MKRHVVEVTVGHSVPSALAGADLSCTIEMSAAASGLRGRVGRLSRTLTRLAVVLCAMQANGVLAQGAASAYPTRPIRIIVPFPPGGATDIMGRVLGAKLTQRWGQQVIIDNRGGAGGAIAAELAARAAPDGYTLFFGASAQLAINANLYAKLPYDSIRDFAPIILVGSGANILVAHPSFPARSQKELIALANAKPRALQ
jgi:tripartite-type tricarboxylate transporter receptor subunit TctC